MRDEEYVKSKQVNFNTLLLVIVNALVLIVCFFFKHELQIIEDNEKLLWSQMMPRKEIELQILNMQERNNKSDLAINDVKIKLIALELEIVKLKSQTK